MEQYSVILVGMMGSGKSVVGRMCASALGLPFVDSDAAIEILVGKTVSDIFSDEGEEAFRAYEQAVIEDVLCGDPCVLATGGGAVVSQAVRDVIKNRGVSIWLDVGLDQLWQRLQGDVDRPLLQADSPRAVLEDKLAERTPLYAQADIRLNISDEGALETLQSLLEELAVYMKNKE